MPRYLRHLFLLAALLPAAFAGPAIDVVQVADLSGPNSNTARDFVTGARTYFDQINAAGGVNGRPINLVVADDGGDPASTVVLSRKLVSQYRPVALFGLFGDDNVLKVLADKQLAGVPLVAPYIGSEQTLGPAVYSLRASSVDEIAKISRIAAQSGIRQMGVVVGDDALSRSIAGQIGKLLKDNHVALTGFVRLPAQGGDIDAAAAQLAGKAPQAVILASPTINAAAFVQAYQRLRGSTPFYALSWVNPQTMQEFLGNEAIRWVAVSALVPSPYNPTLPIAREFVSALKKYRDEPPSYASMEGYLAARMLVDALRGGDASSVALRRNLDSYRRNLGGFALKMDGTNSRASRFVDLAVFSGSGRLVN
ncbi:ABC transporter substrate-binding protein [Chitinimonas sp. BJYL2]|uniref:ABC transporter substrate-binding protein n=1 Tax=Chitinimonas sp. BJYL2 TaxID=2976696 RepID=UPI0022B3C367|nr:ABC transporter substrate-binding protein [Chitinimonas sp. BJYL2]